MESTNPLGYSEKDLFNEFSEKEIKNMFEYMNYSYLLLVDFKDKSVLNINAGNEAIFFAKFGAKQVCALNKDVEKMSFLQGYADNLCLSNVKTIEKDFLEESSGERIFDIVTIIGKIIPIDQLKKSWHVLKDQGKLVVATNNRAGGSSYVKRCKRAGFDKVNIYPIIVDYREPRFVINNAKIYKQILRKFGLSPLINLGAKIFSLLPVKLMWEISPSYVIICEK